MLAGKSTETQEILYLQAIEMGDSESLCRADMCISLIVSMPLITSFLSNLTELDAVTRQLFVQSNEETFGKLTKVGLLSLNYHLVLSSYG